MEPKKLTWRARVFHVIREYQKHGFINHNCMNKAAVSTFHLKHFKNINFWNLLSTMCKMNIVMHPDETQERNKIVFKPGKLDLILENKDSYVLKSENKFVVSQDVAFRKKKNVDPLACPICNKTFASKAATEQHSRDKGHIQKKLHREAEGVYRHIDKGDIVAEVVAGNGNGPETIPSEETNFEVTLKISNLLEHAIILDAIEVINISLRQFITVVYQSGVTINTATSYDVQLRLAFPRQRSYNNPFGIYYTSVDGTISDGFNKHLVFELVPAAYHALLPTSPYIRPKAFAADNDEAIVPGERPDSKDYFKPIIKLAGYPLSKDYIQIFNSGLKGDKLDMQQSLKLIVIKNLLDVPEPMNCLTPANYYELLDLLLFFEEHQMKTDIRNYDTKSNKLVHKRTNRYILEVPELAENRPSLILGDSVYLKEQNGQIKYEGIVHETLLDHVLLGFDAKFNDVYVKKKEFLITFGYNRSTLRLEHQAAKLANQCSWYFFPRELTVPADLATHKLNFYNKDLTGNTQQKRAVEQIVRGTAANVPYLIFGPPGTGKTMTVVEAILQVLKVHTGKPILVCAPSNSAANLICTRLLRFRSFAATELLRYLSLSCSVENIPQEMKKHCNLDGKEKVYPTLESLKTFQVIITTLTTAGRLYNGGIPRGHFAYVFIDESGHATETETLIPITAALVDKVQVRGKVVLAGDPKQLGPIIHSTKAKEYGFGTSMLERLMNTSPLYQKAFGAGHDEYDDRVLTKLLRNYRSHPSIIAVSNEEFYDRELISMGSEMSNVALGHEVLPNPKFPCVFHSVLGHDDREGNSPSFFNIQEIETVVKYLERLVGSRMSGRVVKAEDIAIITPYRKQVQKLKQHCRNRYMDVTIGSIEQLQGQEKLIVIISTVRSKPEHVSHDVKFHLGFLKNPKRFNVALTRAKALMIVVGNPELLQHDCYWRKYIQYCMDNDSMPGHPFNFNTGGVDDLLDGFENVRIEDDIHFGRGNH